MRVRAWLIVVTMVIAAGIARGAQEPGNTTSGALKWHYWGSCDAIEQHGCGRGSLWFGVSRGTVWRYDLRRKTLQVFTPMSGLPILSGCLRKLAVAPDETCVLQFDVGGATAFYRWRPKEGWRKLPTPGTHRLDMRPMGFSPASVLYCVAQVDGKPTLYRLEKDHWIALGFVPACQRLVALEEGFCLGDLGSTGGSAGYIAKPGTKLVVYSGYRWLDLEGAWHVGKNTVGLFDGPGNALALCHIGQGKLKVLYERDAVPGGVGLDLTGNGYLYPVEPDQRGGEMIYGIASTTDKKITKGFGSKLFTMRGALLRDGNGHIWDGANRWDGRSWRAMVPDNHIDAHPKELIDSRWYALDPKTTTWRRVNAHVPPAMQDTFDPATQTAWWFTTVDRRHVYQFVRFASGKRQVLRTVTRGGGVIPAFKDPAGNWWGPGRETGVGADRFNAVRIDSEGKCHCYPCKRGIAGGHRPQMQLSQNGDVWLWEEKANKRYDPKRDAFVAADPWEDFAFAFGPWRLAMAGKIGRRGQELRRKVGGAWHPLPNPFGGDWAMGRPNCIRGDRMLFTVRDIGVLEYDATGDRWAILHASPDFQACFDAEGRRVLTSTAGVLMLVGDPFNTPEEDKESAVFSELLKLLDHEEWRIRDAATQELKKLHSTAPGRLRAAAERDELSPEVRARIVHVLRTRNESGRVHLPGLFERMHPPIR